MPIEQSAFIHAPRKLDKSEYSESRKLAEIENATKKEQEGKVQPLPHSKPSAPINLKRWM